MRRRRACTVCGNRVTTYEMMMTPTEALARRGGTQLAIRAALRTLKTAIASLRQLDSDGADLEPESDVGGPQCRWGGCRNPAEDSSDDLLCAIHESMTAESKAAWRERVG